MLSAEDKKEVVELLAKATASITESITALTEASAKAPTVDALTKSLEPIITARVAEATKAKPDTDKNKPNPSDPKNDDEVFPAWAKELKELVTPIIAQDTAARARAESERIVRAALAAKKLGGLLRNPAVLERLIAACPKDEAAALAAVERERAYAASLGIEAKSFGADQAGEGGRDGSTGEKESSEEVAKRVRGRGFAAL